MNLQKINGPLFAHEALCVMDAGTDSLYVVEFDRPIGDPIDEDDSDIDLAYRFVRGSGAFFHGFILPGDVIKQITVWSD